MVNRREFIVLGAAAAAGWAVPARAETPNLKFGVVTDIHIGGRASAPERLRFALQWLKARGIDAVLCPGDVTHMGRIAQLEEFAAIWRSVFPKDGPKVELMISTGNHDAWTVGMEAESESVRRATRIVHADNADRCWRRLFGEPFEPVWRKTVKGYAFVGAQWSAYRPDLARYMSEHAAELRTDRPFFYCQHAHPAGTVHCGGGDDGSSTRILSAFPNAVAFTGHSHWTVADERAVWQGAFTSVGAGCLHEGGGEYDRENISAFWHRKSRESHVMGPIRGDAEWWGGDPAGGCFLLVEVFDGHLRIQRRSSVADKPIGPDWIVPLPPKAGGPFDPKARPALRRPPAFAPDAKAKVVFHPNGHPLLAKPFAGRDCFAVEIPPVRQTEDAWRVYDYLVEAVAPGATVRRRIHSDGFALPLADATSPSTCLFLLDELKGAKDAVFTVSPLDSFGRAGAPLTAAL